MFGSKEIIEKIALRFSEYLQSDGFVFKKTNKQFVCVNGSFTFIFNLLLTSWNDHYSLSVRLYISEKNIEEIFERVLDKSHKLTLGNTIERIDKSPDGKIVVNGNMAILLIEPADIEAAVDTLKSYYTNIAKPYYERYATLFAIDDIMNSPPFDHCPAHVGGTFENRCSKGLIAARLVNNPNYEKLVSIYDDAIKLTLNEESINNYVKVKEYLMYNRIS